MPTLTQLPLQGDLAKYVLEPNFNYESVVLLTGTNDLLGAVLGLITATGKFKLAEVGAVDGSATTIATNELTFRTERWERSARCLKLCCGTARSASFMIRLAPSRSRHSIGCAFTAIADAEWQISRKGSRNSASKRR